MKAPQSASGLLIAIEAVALVVVLVLGLLTPGAVPKKNNAGNDGTVSQNAIGNIEDSQSTENMIASETTQEDLPTVPVEPVFSEEVLAKVGVMTLEQKVAQMFIITPEALTGTDRVTMTGNTTKNAILEYPVGGLVYSSINFQGRQQTASMLTGVQEHYMEQFHMPVFLMVEERGGQDASPLASANQYDIQASVSEIGQTGDVQNAINAVKNISTYLKECGFNTNLAPSADMNNTYSEDSSVSAMMVAETVSSYGEEGILTVMSMFPGGSDGAFMSKSKEDWEEFDGVVYKAGIDAGADMIMVGNVYASAFTGEDTVLCSMSEDIVNYLRGDMQYQGILVSSSMSDEIVISNYTPAEAAVAMINAGMDMLYCPENFKEAYQGVLDAVADGKISQEVIDEAVARILTCKEAMEVE